MKSQLDERIEAVVAKSRERLKELLEEKGELESRIGALSGELQQEAKKKSAVSERIRGLQQEIAQEAQETLECEAQITAQLNQHTNYQTEITDIRNEIEDISKKYDEEIITINKQYEHNETLRKEDIEEKFKSLKEVEEENDGLREEYEMLSKELQRLEVIFSRESSWC